MSTPKTDSLPPKEFCRSITRWQVITEVGLLMLLFFVYAGDAPPMVNEAHYLVKAKNFWDPAWCRNDLFAASGKAHVTFYVLFGWPTQFLSLTTTAWLGRTVGWFMLALGLQRLSRAMFGRPYLSLAVAVAWTAGIEHGNLAGEWIVGGIEGKVPAYGFILLAIANMVQGRWHWVWPQLGIASAFHVLSGGWSVVAAAVVWLFTERRRDDGARLFSRWLFLGGAISLFGLVPALLLNSGVTPEDATEAAKTYSYFRIKHHLLPADFKDSWIIRHGLLTLFAYGALHWVRQQNALERSRWTSIMWFCGGATLIAMIGLCIGLLPPHMPDLAAKLLRYYWFRVTDAIIPLGFALAVTQVALRMDAKALAESAIATHVARLTICVASVLFGWSACQRIASGVAPSTSNQMLGWDMDASKEDQIQAVTDWLAVCQWAKESTPPEEVFLTPRHQQTFKWYAHRAEVVNWKDVPQDAAALKEWKLRFEEIFPRRLGTVRSTIKYASLREYRETYNTRYIIVDRRVTGQHLPLVRIYPVDEESNPTYAVYELPK